MELVCFILILFPFGFVYAENRTQVDALFAFKKALDDPNGVLSNWTGGDACKWNNIVCNLTTMAVTGVDLGNKSLTGSLVSDLGNLSTLEYLRVNNNKINGSIPAELQNLNNLLSLNLGNNNLMGPIPPQLGKLKKLMWLELNGNKINGSIPAELGNLTSLVSFDLYNNSLTGSIPQELSNLKNLQSLRLDGNKLSGAVPFPTPLTNFFPNLQVLNISGNPGLCGNFTDTTCTT